MISEVPGPSFNREYQEAVEREQHRLKIAELWANVNRSTQARQFDQGRADRLAGRPCLSANGDYVNGWYST